MTTKTGLVTLPASRVDFGHCVIINDCDCPESLTVAVVTKVTPEVVEARYLCNQIDMAECSTTRPREVTPIEWFGVRVLYRPEIGIYVCEPDDTLTATATYRDGKRRPWQERIGPIRRRAKRGPLRVALTNARTA